MVLGCMVLVLSLSSFSSFKQDSHRVLPSRSFKIQIEIEREVTGKLICPGKEGRLDFFDDLFFFCACLQP